MLDFPTFFPPDAFGVRIVDGPNGWSVVIYLSVHLMLLAASGEPLVEDLQYIEAARFTSLVHAIHYCHSERPCEAWLKQWGGK